MFTQKYLLNPFLSQKSSVEIPLEADEIMDKVRLELTDPWKQGVTQGKTYYIKELASNFILEGHLKENRIDIQAHMYGTLKVTIWVVQSISILLLSFGILSAILISWSSLSLSLILFGLAVFILPSLFINNRLRKVLDQHKNIIKCWEHEFAIDKNNLN